MDASTNQNIYATFWQRVAASIIDGVIVAFFIMPALTMFVPLEEMGKEGFQSISNVVSAIFALLYFAFWESSKYQGTPGKIAMKLKVCDLQGRRLRFWQASERDFFKGLPSAILVQLPIADTSLNSFRKYPNALSEDPAALMNAFLVFMLIFFLPPLLYLVCLWTKKRQCIHDMLAKCIILHAPKRNS